MKKYIFLLLAIVFMTSCKSYKSKNKRQDQVTYQEFQLAQKSFTSTDGVLKYIDKGEGPVIVLLHGVPTSGWLYRKMIDPLVNSGYRVIVPDMLGFGASDSPKGYELYNEYHHVKRLLALMKSLQVDKWTHVTHDVGGLWTWELFNQAPDKIEKLVILNTIIFEEGFNPPVRMKPGFFAKTAMWSYRNGITTGPMLKKLFNSGLQKNTLNKVDMEGYKKPLKRGKTKGMYYFFTQTCNALPNYSATFANIKIPRMVIWGQDDDMLKWGPQKEKVKKAFRLQDKDIHLIDEKHFIQETKYDKIVSLISELK